jgi:hypothetical protein
MACARIPIEFTEGWYMDLVGLLRELRNLLAFLVERAEEYVPAYLVGRVRDAWPEVEQRIDEVIREIESGVHDPGLAAHGLLRGPQLELKAHGFQRALWLFRRVPNRRALLKALRWADVILESLASVIPGAGGVAEFKRTLEQAAEDAEDGTAAAMGEPPDEEL